MPKMSVLDVKTTVNAQKADALAALQSAKLSEARASAMNYYLGDMEEDMPVVDGRSAAVSTDVADTIEGLLPNLMDIIAGSDEVVRFEPVGPEDEEGAQQETDYVNHVLMQQNPGWRVLYDFAKDGLTAKNAVCKVWWEENEQEERESYYDLTEDQFALLVQNVEASDGAMKIVEHSVNGEPEAKEPSEATS